MRETVIVNEAIGELRKEPGHAAEQVSHVVLGTPLTLLKTAEERRWLRVECLDGYKGWIRSWATHPIGKQGLAPFRPAPWPKGNPLLPRSERRRRCQLGCPG